MRGELLARRLLADGHGAGWVADETGLQAREVEQVAAQAGMARVPGTDRFARPGADQQAAPRLAVVKPEAIEKEARMGQQTLGQRAQATGDRRVLALHERARDAQERLRVAVEQWEAKADARQRVADLEAQLAQARAALRPGKPAAAAAGSSKAIRAWAAENGIDCPAFGKIPASVRAAWDEAAR